MVALKAELGPFVAGVPGVTGPSWDVFVAAGSDALPLTGTALGTFEHNSATDPYDKGLTHVGFHHIQDILYRRQKDTPAVAAMFPYGFTDMSVIRMKRHGANLLSTAMTGAGVTMAIAATATIVLKGQPGDVAIANADVIFTSGNIAIATVAATGVVTGVAVGNTIIHCVNRYNGLIIDVPVAVTATVGELEVRARDDDERPDNPKVAVKDLPKGDPRLAQLETKPEAKHHEDEGKKTKK